MAERTGIWRTKSFASLQAEQQESRLKRSLTSIDLVTLGIGAIIGTGIFVLTGVAAAEYAGPGLVLSFVMAGLAAGFAALVYAELAAMIPVAGSAYTYSYASLGELVAWIVGWNLMLEYMIASGAVAIGWGSYLVDFVRAAGFNLPASLVAGPFQGGLVNLPAVFIAILATVLVIRGTQQSAKAAKIVVLVKLAVIALFLIIGSRFVNTANWNPFLPFGVAGIFQGAAIIFFAYIGFDAVATAAEETKRPQRDLPIGIVGSLAVSTLLYILVTLVLTGLVPYTQLNTASPVATALLRAGIPLAGSIVALGALAGITGVLLVMLYGQSRIFYAMSRDGLIPKVFSKVHPRFNTPFVSSLVVGVVVVLTAGFLPIAIVAQLANIGTLTAFVIASVGVLVLRRTRPDLPRPFKVPFMPWTALLAIGFSFYLILNLPPLTWVRFVVWMALGLAVYFGYGYRHSTLNRDGRPLAWWSLFSPALAKPHRNNGTER